MYMASLCDDCYSVSGEEVETDDEVVLWSMWGEEEVGEKDEKRIKEKEE